MKLLILYIEFLYYLTYFIIQIKLIIKSFKMFTPLEDIKLETIDFKWIQETTKISHLKRAIKLIEMDGNFFADLK